MWKLVLASIRKLLSSQGIKITTTLGRGGLKEIGKLLSALLQENITSNPFIKEVLTADINSQKYKEAFKKLADKELPTLDGFREIMSALNIKDPSKLISDLKNKPEQILNKIKNAPPEVQEKITNAVNADANSAPLSSSWLAYGTFIPNLSNPSQGRIILTTKTGKQFQTPSGPVAVWNKMKKQIGVTIYKNGKRVGASFGAGTILHRFYPRRTWRKVKR